MGLKAVSGFPPPPGGGFTGTNVPYVLSRSAIPFIALSSGSVSAAGAISGITALPAAYASAYCYFPANALATAIAAGWYYCTFSTTTAGTAFLNTYTAGDPTIPGSPTAVTDGKGAFTGVTAEVAGPTITVPANALGPNGALRIRSSWSTTNSAGAKTARVRYSAIGGTAVTILNGVVNIAGGHGDTIIQNRAATNSQVLFSTTTLTSSAVQSTAILYSATDTTAATTVVLSHNHSGAATDNLILESYIIEAMYGA